MATKFKDLARLIRKIVGDHDDRKHQFSDETIYDHIRITILELDETSIAEGDGLAFTQDLSNVNVVRVIFRAARSLISPVPNEFSYKTPILSVRRKNAVIQILSRVEDAIANAEGGAIAFASDSFLEAFYQGPEKLADEISEAIV